MSAVRIILIFHLLAALWISIPACGSVKYCVSFTGENGCIKGNYTEPDLPPIINDCCGPHCTYTAPNGPPGPCDDTTARGRCLLDIHCSCNLTFIFREITDCDLRDMNDARAAAQLARYLSFNWNETFCLEQNFKCGINCCCRETCPEKFCKIVTSSTCP
ncbi:hypothetical protein KR038_011700 [Drosophila bunnanda]|nr:hypothetical protein KR038_011700 [Drosophila bunnanda]